MAYSQFETEKAEYVLLAGYHGHSNPSWRKLEGIDALVLEYGGPLTHSKLARWMKTEDGWFENDLLRPLIYCAEKKIPVFSADIVMPSILSFIKIAHRDLIPLYLGRFYFWCNRDKVYSEKEYDKQFKFILANNYYLTQTPLVEGRNAVAARKIEEWIVPQVKSETGKVKPKIGLVYGTGHLGLEPDLKSKRRRNFTLWNMRNFNFWKWAGLGRLEDLNKIYEARYKEEGWSVTEHQANLFD